MINGSLHDGRAAHANTKGNGKSGKTKKPERLASAAKAGFLA
jgi:hypothetical protein